MKWNGMKRNSIEWALRIWLSVSVTRSLPRLARLFHLRSLHSPMMSTMLPKIIINSNSLNEVKVFTSIILARKRWMYVTKSINMMLDPNRTNTFPTSPPLISWLPSADARMHVACYIFVRNVCICYKPIIGKSKTEMKTNTEAEAEKKKITWEINNLIAFGNFFPPIDTGSLFDVHVPPIFRMLHRQKKE